jgi:hypothetical protein
LKIENGKLIRYRSVRNRIYLQIDNSKFDT